MFRHPRLLPREEDFTLAAHDIAAARSLFATKGWLDDPGSYHQKPTVPSEVERSGAMPSASASST